MPFVARLAIEISVSNDFLSTFVDSVNVFDCHLSGVIGYADNADWLALCILQDFIDGIIS